MKETIKSYIVLYQTNKHAKRLARKVQSDSCQCLFYNWWTHQTTDAWFYRFAKYRGLLDSTNKQIAFFSVFGPREIYQYDNSDVKIFYSGENLKLYPNFADGLLNFQDLNLSLGFDYWNDARYVRFPIWLRTQFCPEWNENDILSHIHELRFPSQNIDKSKFCSIIASHDSNGIRKEICDWLSDISKIDSAGLWMNNDKSLKLDYNDNKQRYLNQYLFNISAENSNAPGYVTEKIFDAIAAGCIPIYWGANMLPEPEVLNQEAIIFFDRSDNSRDRIAELWNNKKLAHDFLLQPRLNKSAEEIIIEKFEELTERMKVLLS